MNTNAERKNAAQMSGFRRALAFVPVLAASLVVSALVWIDHANDDRIKAGNMALSALVVVGIFVLQAVAQHDRNQLARALRESVLEHERVLTTDDLTGLHNRRVFLEQLDKAAGRSLMTSQPMALIVIDIDSFGQFNDENGHGAGDMMLIEIGHRIRRVARSKDIVARFGSDEFTCLVIDVNEDIAVGVAERLREAIHDTKITLASGSRLGVTASVGVAAATGRSEVGTDSLMARATRAMHRAREFGMDRVVCARLPTSQFGTPRHGRSQHSHGSEPSHTPPA